MTLGVLVIQSGGGVLGREGGRCTGLAAWEMHTPLGGGQRNLLALDVIVPSQKGPAPRLCPRRLWESLRTEWSKECHKRQNRLV